MREREVLVSESSVRLMSIIQSKGKGFLVFES